jgi:lipid II:glycine glycyltransferase (peptidoglycan interpeptide bridge formation enzyme)
MAQITIKTVKEKEEWEDFNRNHSPSNLLQSWNWGQFQRSMRNPTRYWGIYENSELVGLCLAHKIKTRFRTHTYIPNGPIINWDKATDIFPRLILKIKKFAQKTNSAFIRMDPLIIDSKENKAILTKYNFKKASTNVQPPTKWILDIAKDKEALLEDMGEDTQYAIKKAQKEGVTIHSSIDFKDFENFWTLFRQTSKRRRNIPHPKKYYIKQIKAFGPDRQYRIYWAQYKGDILAASLIPFYGDSAYYLHNAASLKHKEVFAPQLLVWQAIQDAQAEDIRYFDFHAVAPENNPKHPWADFTKFKKSFGGFSQKLMPAYDLPIKQLQYFFIRSLESTQNIWRMPYYKLMRKFDAL